MAPGGGPCIGAVGGGTLCPPGGGASLGSGIGRGDAGACCGEAEPLGADDACSIGKICGNNCCIIAGLIGGAFGPDILVSLRRYSRSGLVPNHFGTVPYRFASRTLSLSCTHYCPLCHL